MAKVKDTETFIARAREIHGDLYDYSQTVYAGALKPISFSCSKCFKQHRISQATTHLRQKKLGCSGCREVQAGRAKERPCKNCDRPVGSSDPRQSYCCRKCGFEYQKNQTKKKMVSVQCHVCGKPLKRHSSALNIRERFACSLDCQAVMFAAGKRKVDWLSKSAKAKEEYKRASSKKRRSRNEWFMQVGRAFRKLRKLRKLREGRSSVQGSDWEIAVGVRLQAGRGRPKPVGRRALRPSRTAEQALTKLRGRRKYFELSDWEKKVGFRLSSHKQRRRRKDAAKQKAIKGISDSCKDTRKRKQMCFVWLEDKPNRV